MLGQGFLKAAAALLLAVAGAGGTMAQNYDGSGLVKFGVFGQGMFIDAKQSLPVAATARPEGFSGGVSAGYDLRLHHWFLIGAEIDGSFGDARDRAGLTDYGFDYLLTLRGRMGVYARPDWLIYGTAGVGFLGMEAQRPGIGNKAFETMTGFVGGVGTEIDWHHVIFFGEYLYGNYGDREFTITDNSGIFPVDLRHKTSFDSHLFRLGIKFKVGHDYKHGGYGSYEPLK